MSMSVLVSNCVYNVHVSTGIKLCLRCPCQYWYQTVSTVSMSVLVLNCVYSVHVSTGIGLWSTNITKLAVNQQIFWYLATKVFFDTLSSHFHCNYLWFCEYSGAVTVCNCRDQNYIPPLSSPKISFESSVYLRCPVSCPFTDKQPHDCTADCSKSTSQ